MCVKNASGIQAIEYTSPCISKTRSSNENQILESYLLDKFNFHGAQLVLRQD